MNVDNDCLDWDEMVEEQKFEVVTELLHKRNVEGIFKKIEDYTSHSPTIYGEITNNIMDQIFNFLKEHWDLNTSKSFIKPYILNKTHIIDIPNSVTDTVCIVSIGSSFTLRIYKEFPEGSKTSVLFRSVLVSPGTAMKIEGSALRECEFIISGTQTETIYLIYYH